MQRCARCGKEVEDGLRFCVWCGAAMEIPAGPPPVPDAPSQDAAATTESPAGPVPPPLPGAPAGTGQAPPPVPEVPRAPSPLTGATAPTGSRGDAATPLDGMPDGTPTVGEAQEDRLDETVVLRQPPETAPHDPAADTVIAGPLPVPGVPGSAPAGADAAPSPPPGDGPEPGAATVVSTTRVEAPATTPRGEPSPLDPGSGAPPIPGSGTAPGYGETPQIVETDEEESGSPGPPAPVPGGAGTAPVPPASGGAGEAPVQTTRPAGGRTWLVAGAAALLALLLVGAGWWFFGGHHAAEETLRDVKVIRLGNTTPVEPQEETAARRPTTGSRPAAGMSRPSQHPPRPTTGKITAPAQLPRAGLLRAAVDVSGLPLQPPPAAIVYSGKRFKGRSQTFPVGEVAHLRGTVLHDNAASSLKVVDGARVTLYLKPGFIGRSETFPENCSSLKGSKIRNNRASSLRVEPPRTGPVLWRAGPVQSLGVELRIEGYRDGVSLRTGGERTYVLAGPVPVSGHGLGAVVRSRAGLAGALGRPRSAAVRVAEGRLAVQLFAHGVVVYSPGSKRGWYRLDGR